MSAQSRPTARRKPEAAGTEALAPYRAAWPHPSATLKTGLIQARLAVPRADPYRRREPAGADRSTARASDLAQLASPGDRYRRRRRTIVPGRSRHVEQDRRWSASRHCASERGRKEAPPVHEVDRSRPRSHRSRSAGGDGVGRRPGAQRSPAPALCRPMCAPRRATNIASRRHPWMEEWLGRMAARS